MSKASEATQFKSKGVGITSKTRAFAFKVSEKYEDVLLMLPNRSEKIREWVIQGMIRDGLIHE